MTTAAAARVAGSSVEVASSEMAAEEAGPLLVALLTIGIPVAVQPLESTLADISLNWVAVLVVAVGGVLGTFQ